MLLLTLTRTSEHLCYLSHPIGEEAEGQEPYTASLPLVKILEDTKPVPNPNPYVYKVSFYLDSH